MLEEVNLLAHLSNAGLRQWHLSGVVEWRKAPSLSPSGDGNRACGDCLCAVLNLDCKTMKMKVGGARGSAPLSQIDS